MLDKAAGAGKRNREKGKWMRLPEENTVPKAIRVEIYDQTYHVRGELDEKYVGELARFVDQKMRDVAEATRTVDSLRVAVLAALNIADELHALRAQHAELQGTLHDRAERCLSLVEQALKQSA